MAAEECIWPVQITQENTQVIADVHLELSVATQLLTLESIKCANVD